VALRTTSLEIPTLRSLGFEVEPVEPRIEAIAADDWEARSPMGAARQTARAFLDRAMHDGPDLARAIEEEHPDALLVDVATWGALGAAEAWGGPWACFCPLPLPLPSRDVPPFGPGFRPARGRLGSLCLRPIQAFVDRGFDNLVRRRLNESRASFGLRPFGHAYEMFLRPPLLLCMTAEGFEYPRSDWPENVVLVGPCAWDPPAELPGELADVRAPFVLVSTSSEFQNDDRLVRTALAALAGEPCHVVATLPAASGAGMEVPANATLLPFVPHAPILARSLCAITHGGMGVTQKALAEGVPVCAVPFGRDQLEVARRVEVAGAGARLPAQRLSPARLRAKVREASRHRHGAEQVARAFATTAGGRTAADAFEQRLLATGAGGRGR
jgi:UDP:flavonoid glycosyltransferase YjiC (YdhE family)